MDSVGFFWFQNFSTIAVMITAAMRISSTTPTTELTMITRKFCEISKKCRYDMLFLHLYFELYRSTDRKKFLFVETNLLKLMILIQFVFSQQSEWVWLSRM